MKKTDLMGIEEELEGALFFLAKVQQCIMESMFKGNCEMMEQILFGIQAA